MAPMYLLREKFSCLIALVIFAAPLATSAIVFTSDATISPSNSNYDNFDIIVSNCTLTVDGPHTFENVVIAGGGILTHTFAASGNIPNQFSVTNELQTLSGTNAVALSNANVILPSIQVSDTGNTVVYTNGIDYVVSDLGGALTGLARTTNSSIGDGANVFVSYDVSLGTVPSGLTLTLLGDLNVMSNGTITASGRGYGGNVGPGKGGQAGGVITGAGSSHGGYGGISSSNALAGATYGSYAQPNSLGSGGGQGYGGVGGAGGGAIRLVVAGTATIDGSIAADGANGINTRSGGGSGGSIWLTASNFAGAGSLSANGGGGEPIHGGGGGGGRIAIEYTSNSFTGTTTAFGGNGWMRGGAGTIYSKPSTQTGSLVLDNGGLAGTNTTVTVTNSAAVTVRGAAIGMMNGAQTLASLLVSSNSSFTVLPYPLVTTSQPLTVLGNLTVQPSGSILADGIGDPANVGLGLGRYYPSGTTNYGGGGGHGGYGATAPGSIAAFGGTTYDSTAVPTAMGSGGGGFVNGTNSAGAGGGAIRISVSGTLQIDGKISANGTAAVSSGGGGSGGSIWLTVAKWSGSGIISANGGAGNTLTGGGGGGGRVVVEYSTNIFAGVISAYGGGGLARGGAGTIFTRTNSQTVGQLVLDNGGVLGTNTSFSVASLADVTIKNGAATLPTQTIRNLILQSNGWLTLPPYPGFAPALTVLADALIDPGAGINGDGLGSGSGSGGLGVGGSQNVSGVYYGGGGGHGGYGGSGGHTTDRGGTTYDSLTGPASVGSPGGGSGSSFTPFGGPGGGAIRLTVNGKLTLNGRISADGLASVGNNGGGGSGGAIWLTLGSLAGSGLISAAGGAGTFGGGGGGGRIAITFNTNQFAGGITAYGGAGTNRGGAGTVYIRTNTSSSGVVIVNNGGQPGTNTTLSLNTAATLLVADGGMVLPTGGATLTGLTVGSNGTLFASQSLVVSGDATIQAGGALSMDGLGSPAATGAGAGSGASTTVKGGGGHGGYGAGNGPVGGGTYDSITFPSIPGSGGGNGSASGGPPLGGAGGGAAHVTIERTLTVNGRLSANGLNGDLNSGGGSGGAVWLTVGTLTGNGVIAANGGNGNGIGAGGGGGRISISYNSNSFAGALMAAGGGGAARGGAGTIYTKLTSAPAGRLLIDNNGVTGTNTPLGTAYGLPLAPFDLVVNSGAVMHPQTALPLLSNVTVNAGATITCLTNPTSIVLSTLGNFNIQPGAIVVADGKGFGRSTGPGAGASVATKGAGGGYGGAGGTSGSGAAGGITYGSATQPVDRGSGGGAGANSFFGGCDGGGAIRLDVGGTLTVNGTLTADGNAGVQDDSGGGAGGSIWVNANAFSGNGFIAARGGSGDLYGGGGGGGGRIAIYSPANTFTGLVSAVGGDGATPGQTGTIFTSTTLSDFVAVSNSPTDTVYTTVSFVDLTFSQAVNPSSLSPLEFMLFTPGGPLPQSSFSTSLPGMSTVRVSFPQQNLVGDYRLEVGQGVQSIFGQPMSQVYTGYFTINIPTISGQVTNRDSSPVPGVLIQPTGGLVPVTTDSSGNYSVGVPPGWTGQIVPSLDTNMFVPGTFSFNSVTSSVTNQNFLMIGTIAPVLTTSVGGTNLFLHWPGIVGVTYQPLSSTNLIDWVPAGPLIPGAWGVMEFGTPVDGRPAQFFRMGATN